MALFCDSRKGDERTADLGRWATAEEGWVGDEDGEADDGFLANGLLRDHLGPFWAGALMATCVFGCRGGAVGVGRLVWRQGRRR